MKWLVGMAAAVALAGPARAQDFNRAGGPVFFAAEGGRRVDVRNAAVLKQRVALDLRDVPISAALSAIATGSGVRFTYATEDLPPTLRVTLQATSITVAAALTEVLLDAGLDVQLAGPAHLALVRREGPAPRAIEMTAAAVRSAGGTVTGLVTDSSTGATVPYVIVTIEETGRSTQSSPDGVYRFTDVAPGQYRVSARRVGFVAKTRPVIVEEGKSATLNFALNQPPTKMDEVVTTAVGDQRRYTVGTSIATINVDSLAPTTPVTSITDIISARAPGVEVLENSGMTGAGEAIRIRGLSSLVLQNDPIIIVDGVREDNSAGGNIFTYGIGSGTHPTPSRLNDLDFNDIETIDILKGPAASTEYGTDAANGVIVITTKHGTSGRPQWHLSAEQTESDIPEKFPNGYYSWGHTTDGQHTPVDCPLISGSIVGYSSTGGTCTVDSVTQWNPLNHAATSIFGTGTREKADLSVGGGGETVRYYLTGGLSNETGVVRLPQVFRQLADTANLGLPSAALNPNTEQQRSGRVNTTIRLGATADLSVTASYLSTYQQTPEASTLYLGVFSSPALSDPAHFYGYDSFNGSTYTPIGQATQVGSQNTDRVTGGLNLNWRPVSWFVGHAAGGLDHGSQRNETLNYPLNNPAFEGSQASIGIADVTTDVYSADLRGTATASLTHNVRAVTSVGLQMVDTRVAGQTALSVGITPINLTLNGATAPRVSQLATRQATLGGYGEEQLGFADRLFVTGAIRVDAGSGFGSAYNTAIYPKASLSWLAVNGASTTLRLRAAFGESGVQPQNGAALQLYVPWVTYLGGGPVSTTILNAPGNPNLKPERSAEFEGGIDVGGWRNRLTFELTGYSKTTHDALVNVPLGATLGNYPYQENIGEVRNTGLEATVTVTPVETRAVTWNLVVNASVNHNDLVSLAPGVVAQTSIGEFVQFRQEPGYPLYGIWAPKATYSDANHDGIIERNEVKIADSASYLGASLPTQEASISTHIALFNGTLTVGALVDYRGGYKIANEQALYADFAANTEGSNDPHAPLWMQARAAANRNFNFNSLDVEDGAFVRFRELSVTYAVPRSWSHALRMANLSLTAAVRNLALWTRYSGVDPEVTNSPNVVYNPLANGTMLNSDQRSDFGAVPLARYWVLRLNAGF